MKRILLFFLMLTTILCYGNGNFANASVTAEKEPAFQKEIKMIENLFKQRSTLWNTVYDESKRTEDFIEQLSEFVGEPLLSFDREVFESIKKFPTEIDKVRDLQILHIEDVSYGKDEISAKIKMNWKMQGMTAPYSEEINYIVLLKNEDNRWKLCDYKIIQ